MRTDLGPALVFAGPRSHVTTKGRRRRCPRLAGGSTRRRLTTMRAAVACLMSCPGSSPGPPVSSRSRGSAAWTTDRSAKAMLAGRRRVSRLRLRWWGRWPQAGGHASGLWDDRALSWASCAWPPVQV